MPLDERPVTAALRALQPVKNCTLGVALPRSGVIRWFDATAIPVLDASGLLHHVVLTFVDITARKEAEDERARLLEAARTRAARLRLLVETTSDLIGPRAVDEIGTRGIDRIIAFSNYDDGYLYLADERGGLVQVASATS
jgi:hypothetical protein